MVNSLAIARNSSGRMRAPVACTFAVAPSTTVFRSVPPGRSWSPSRTPRPGRRPLLTFCIASGGFKQLADLSGSLARDLELLEGDNGRGVFVSRDFRPGDVVLSIPLSSCFIVGVESGLSLPGASLQDLAAGKLEDWPLLQAATAGKNGATFRDLSWDLRLALAVADMRLNYAQISPSSLGAAAPAEKAKGGFSAGLQAMLPRFGKQARKEPAPPSQWLPMYSHLLPSHHSSPFCFPSELLQLLHDNDLEARAQAEKQRIQQVLADPGMAAALGNSLSEHTFAWALGMARSRAFDATPGTFVMAPVLDMVNHAWKAPNAEVQLRLSGTGGSSPDEAVFLLQGEVAVTAVRSIPKGSEVLFSYGCNYMPNSDLILRYGMMRPGGNANDLLPLADIVLSLPEQEEDRSLEADQAEVSSDKTDLEEEDGGDCIGSAIIDMQVFEASLKAAVEREGGRWLQTRANDGEVLAIIASFQALSEISLTAECRPSLLDMRDAISEHVKTLQKIDDLACNSGGVLSTSDGPNPADIVAVTSYGSKQKALWTKALWAVEAMIEYAKTT